MPELRFPRARGDQCDNCGKQLDPIDLIDPRSKIDATTPEFRETKHCFSTCRVSRSAASSGSSPRRTGARTCATSRSSWPARSGRVRSRGIWTGVSACPWPATRRIETSASTSGSTPSSATCRRRSNGRRRGGPGRLARLVAGPRVEARATSWARTTSSSTRSSGPRSCSDTATVGSLARGGR